MRKLSNILILSIIYLVFCGKSCENENEQTAWQEQEVTAARDSIRDEFETDYLSEEARYAAGVKAIQELNDLADYVEIYTDVSMDSLFREKAGEMIRGIFISKDNKLSFGQVKNKKMKSVFLEEFLEEGFGDDIKKTEIIFDSIRVLEPLQKSDESTYSGKLAAYQNIILHPMADSIISSANQITIKFISSKQDKIIGKDTLKVWVVSLGDMEL